MKSATFDPRRLDVAAFALASGRLEGSTELAALRRLAEGTLAPADGAPGSVQWVAQGAAKPRAGGAPELRLHLQAQASVWLTCQRCLQPSAHRLDVDRSFRFVPGEDEAARLDEESEEDVLALPRALELADLIEDELILALPIVPRHEACPDPLTAAAVRQGPAEAAEQAPHPFAALATLRRASASE